MKTAIYIEDGVVQLVITPESEFEKNALSSFQEKPLSAQIFSGSFYDCKGGWIRQANVNTYSFGPQNKDDKSLIIRVESKDALDSPISDLKL